jgi:molybdate transport system ATP-binding protein
MTEQPSASLRIEGVSKVFEGAPAVNDFSLDVAPGEFVSLLGPSGCGKTTLLRMIGGFEFPDRGRIVLDDEDITSVAPNKRPINMVFQRVTLFPHLDVAENLAFGLRLARVAKPEIERRVKDALELVRLPGFERRKVETLSGGQAQRVALARALATQPRLLLLDEPLAALDARSKVDLRHELARHLASFQGTCLVVTHDPVEALALADQLVVLEAGSVTQCGSAADVTGHPRSGYIADLVGINLLRGRAAGDVVQLPQGERLVVPRGHDGSDVFVVIQPAAVALYRSRPDGSPRNIWRGPVEILDVAGDRVRVRVGGPVPLVAEVTPAAVSALKLGEGGAVWAAVKAREIKVYPA